MINSHAPFRQYFPFHLKYSEVIYFDNASTSQKPFKVIEQVKNHIDNFSANARPGSHEWSGTMNIKVAEVRKKVAQFINAQNIDDVIFTAGATDSLERVALQWGFRNLKDGDEILYSPYDHQSAILPWSHLKKLLEKVGIKITLISYKILPKSGDADVNDILEKVSDRTRVLAISHLHNIFGLVSEVEKLKGKLSQNIVISLDACQSLAHLKVDVQKLGVDFLSFSGHKMFALDGVGVLWVSPRLQKEFMVEQGTKNVLGIISLGAAIDFINEIGIAEIQSYLKNLTQYLLEQLKKFPQIEFLPGPFYIHCGVAYGIVSFKVKGISSQDLGFILSNQKVYVRAGDHCILHNEYSDSLRISLQISNTKEEVDRFILLLKQILTES